MERNVAFEIATSVYLFQLKIYFVHYVFKEQLLKQLKTI